MTVLDVPSSNRPPTAEAGSSRTVDAGSTVTLSGRAADPEGRPLSYLWSQLSPGSPKVTLGDPDSRSTSFRAPSVPSNTDFTFRFTASDGENFASDTVTITVRQAATANSPPTVDAGPSLVVDAGDIVSISAAATDPDGDPLTYRWSASSGHPAIVLADPASASTTFTAPASEHENYYILRVTVSDGTDQAATSLHVTVRAAPPTDPANRPPTVSAGSWQRVSEGSTVALSGTASDPDNDTLTYRWTQLESASGIRVTLSDPGSLRPTFVAPLVDQDSSFLFQLTVSDGTTTASDWVFVDVLDR